MPELLPPPSSLTLFPSRSLSYNAGVLVGGKEALLIDPGLFADDIDRVRAHIYNRDAEPHCLVVTHSHWDHVLGPEYFPGVPVIQQQESLAVLAESGTMIEHQVTEWERQSGIQRDMPFLLHEPDRTFTDRLELQLGGKIVELLHAPGHASEQLVVHDRAEQLLWAADMLSDIEIPFVMHNLNAYRQTLDRLAQLEVTTLVPGHGAPAQGQSEVRARFDTDRTYLAELQKLVEAALSSGRSAAETVTACASMSYAIRDQNEEAHRLNVETAFLELGGTPDRRHPGWNRFQ
ncbi:MBL fold metallo-hydrolase [candidate division WOR-3 bacterium]|uniref:MBL fold metallo-hydrolase n=1 Tax=candidate division WOR-3 bacterium TaxID=2052148 RepID=A0A937XF15_UNCW3|nr:MBL fold metallo-hydrolase [candidate division WOR-3 bacterium]